MASKREAALSQWAAKHGHRFDPGRTEFEAEGARELDLLRKWKRAKHHVSGIHRDRAFEMIDVTYYYRGGEAISWIDQTVLLMPGATKRLPDFEILPRGLINVLGAFHLGGLEISPPEDSPSPDGEGIKDFNRHYHLYKAGVIESARDAMSAPGTPDQDFAQLASLFRPPVLRFLTQHPGWSIESQNGFLAITAHEKLLDDTERDALLSFANELLSMLLHPPRPAVAPAAAPAPQMRNVMQPKRLLGTVIGGGVGFFVGALLGIVLLFFVDGKLIVLLLPVLAIIGLGLGGFVGGKLARTGD